MLLGLRGPRGPAQERAGREREAAAAKRLPPADGAALGVRLGADRDCPDAALAGGTGDYHRANFELHMDK